MTPELGLVILVTLRSVRRTGPRFFVSSYLDYTVLVASKNAAVIERLVDVDIRVLAANRQETTVCITTYYIVPRNTSDHTAKYVVIGYWPL